MQNFHSMKTRTYLIALFSILLSVNAGAQKPHFYIACLRPMGDTSQKYAGTFERLMASYISEAFPCAKITTQGDVVTKLQREKLNQLLGSSDEMPSFCDDLPHDYWVYLNLIDYTEGRVMAVARCFKYKKIKCIAEAGNVRVNNDFSSLKDGCNTLAKRLIDLLSKVEVCAFTGPVTITQNSTLDSTNTLDYAVYCNENDQRYHKEIEIHNNTYSEWKLERMGIPRTEGDMTFYTHESSKMEEQDGCHVCKSGREGGWSSSRETSFKVNGSGISHESKYKGRYQDDTRIDLKFLEEGKYILIAKGTSQPVTGEENVTTHAEGTCDNQPQQTKPEPRDMKVPLMVIFGPYDGKSTDKVLQQNDSKKIDGPGIGEKTTITIDFNLKHD